MQKTLINSRVKLSEIEMLSYLSDIAYTKGLSLAVWRLPNNEHKHLILSKRHQVLNPTSFTLEELSKGFIFSPFDPSKSVIHIPADFLFSFKDDELCPPEDPIQTTSAAWLSDILQKNEKFKKREFEPIKSIHSSTDQPSYQEIVKKAIEEIECGRLGKVVPSRTTVLSLPENFNVIQIFDKLCDAYPAAMVSLISIPGVGDWLGATPELLVQVEDRTIFRTVALAGTQPYHPGINLKSVAWTQKEIEEQALVSRYIINCFKQIRLREFEEHGPKTVVAGNLMHLKTDFTVDMKATNFPQLGTVMMRLLHPTSAVCGMPLNPAFDFLKQNEGYDREFYSGYLGPINFNNNIDIFVNLRCMQLKKENAILYAGAGITLDSVPENEWKETEIKFHTLLKVIS